MYRWGYYLGTGAMSNEEFKVAINALFSQAKFQGDPQVRRICTHLNRRLRGLNIESNGGLLYPHLELLGQLELIPIKVRFYPPVTTFILEGERRHPKQKIIKGAKNKLTGELSYIDYIVPLPPRSFDEFLLWVNKYMANAQVLYPPELVQKHYSSVEALRMRYWQRM
jgi:WYL domain